MTPFMEGTAISITPMLPAITPADILSIIGQVVTWGTALILLWVAYGYVKKNINSLLRKGKIK